MRISDWSSDVCSSDLMLVRREEVTGPILPLRNYARIEDAIAAIHRHAPPQVIHYFGRDPAERRHVLGRTLSSAIAIDGRALSATKTGKDLALDVDDGEAGFRSEEHTSELQSLMRISYAVFCLKKKKKKKRRNNR